mgnify:CR=1 FL=1
MEAALDVHRRARAPAGATEHARAETGRRRVGLRSILRWPHELAQALGYQFKIGAEREYLLLRRR